MNRERANENLEATLLGALSATADFAEAVADGNYTEAALAQEAARVAVRVGRKMLRQMREERDAD